jgi:hypothetical protein
MQLVGAPAVDADSAGDINTSKSTSSFYVRGGKLGTVSVYTTLQSLVFDSPAMAETYARGSLDFLRDLIWQREFDSKLVNKQTGATLVCADNKAMIAHSKYPVNHGTSKHYRTDQHFNREQVENEVAYFDYTLTKGERGRHAHFFFLFFFFFLVSRALIRGGNVRRTSTPRPKPNTPSSPLTGVGFNTL